jgi:site-specific recombinase XerD
MSLSIQEAVSLFFNEFQFPEGSKNTKRTYKTALKKFLDYCAVNRLSEKEVESIDPAIVSRFGAWLIQSGLTDFTQNIYESALRRALNFWRIKGLILFSSDEEKEARQAMRIQSKKKNRYISSRVGRVPEDFGDRMVRFAYEENASTPPDRLSRLKVLRLQALVQVLRATGLRVGDTCRLIRSDIRYAETHEGYFTLQMQKTGSLAHCFLGDPALEAVQAYLQERSDNSPWVFIQHGRTGKTRTGTPQFFRVSRRGYGARLSTKTAWEIIRQVGRAAYGKTAQFISPHAFRHWHAQSLIRAGARLEDVQSVLGHANPVITKQIYAPEPDLSRISEKEKIIQNR